MKLFYRRLGSGPTLIILHGLYGSSDNWLSVAKSISDRFTIILPDQRNHGSSPWSDIHDYESMSNDLLELADNLNLDKFFLAGHSMGGKTAMNFALKSPERLNGLVVADISPFVNDSLNTEAANLHLSILNAVLSVDTASLTSRKEAELKLAGLVNDERITGLLLKNLQRNQDGTYSWKINASVLLKNLDKILEGIDPRKASNLQTTGFPVLFLKGSNSNYLPGKDFREISLIFPAAEFIIIPEAGHWLHSDNPEAVKRALLSLLEN